MKFKCGLSKTAIRNLVLWHSPIGLTKVPVRYCNLSRNKRWYSLDWDIFHVDVFAWDGDVHIVYYRGYEKFYECLADPDYLIDHKLCA